ncbi:gfo/Idh/MocA family oxidoreductase [Romboutsia weinsteinii]|uniref:Gfo/Idh/MocA family oxidoreductase n=1 Tax=Romboutsia weinsteinii TaxID=2020949 RepID=A0A371J8U4_9FIRM|nr:Gfo/Idh/MocA family oxidoreductase [Romboutsia weinsteinii]RDY29179.1 gfo/Idh/MocA family oxidoreductase [Romboutsia weinsteinii]
MYTVGIVGLGQIAYSIDKDPNRDIIWSHIGAYKTFENIEIKAICDISSDVVEEVKNDCNIKLGYSDYNKMLDYNKFDIVSICTPISSHYDIIKKCVSCGVKAIFCEKTLCNSVEDAKKIIKLCEDNNVVLAVNHILRWDNLNITIKKLIENKAIGDIYSIVGYGDTALHTSASHLIDMMCFFAGSPEWVVGTKQNDFIRVAHGVEDHGGIGIVKFKSNIIGFIKATSTSQYRYMYELDILGEEGRIKIYNNGKDFDIYKYSRDNNSAGTNYQSLQLVENKPQINKNERMVDAIEDIIRCLEKGGSPISNGSTSLNTIKIIEGLKKSSDEIQIVSLVDNLDISFA